MNNQRHLSLKWASVWNSTNNAMADAPGAVLRYFIDLYLYHIILYLYSIYLFIDIIFCLYYMTPFEEGSISKTSLNYLSSSSQLGIVRVY